MRNERGSRAVRVAGLIALVVVALAALALRLARGPIYQRWISDEEPPAPDGRIIDLLEERGDDAMGDSWELVVGDATFTVSLEDTDAARELATRLPLQLTMTELNGNEKYAYLDEPLPTDALQPGTIHAGDVMLFGDDCLVVFYGTFSSGYRYTPIGRVDDSAGLAEALGAGDVVVAWSRALARHRAEVHVQVHIGAEYTKGDYGWTTDAPLAIAEFEQRLRSLKTDYADFGFIHCIDEDADLDRVMNGGIWDYVQRAHQDGTIRHLAFSTHSTHIARRLVATGAFDLAMFSLNPMYDYTDESEYGRGEASDRMELYREFERAGVGVSVMKPFAGGQLLDAATSPFGRALTRAQCIQYALDKPGVLTVLPGVRGMGDLQEVLRALDASPEERDYSVLAQMAPQSREARCVYCNHCQPCPVGIPIALVNKYYDLARLGDELAADHYRTLEHHAGECVSCGHCDGRCPFGVAQSDRMSDIAAFFGR